MKYLLSIRVTLSLVALCILLHAFKELPSLLSISADQVLLKYEFWRVFTYPFVHMNIHHLIWNVTTLFITSSIIELYSRKLFVGFLVSTIFLTSIFILLNTQQAVNVLGYSNISAAGLCFGCFIIYLEGIERQDSWLRVGSIGGYFFFWSYELTLFELLTPWEYVTGSAINGTSGMKINPGHIAGMALGSLFGFILLFSQHIQAKQGCKNQSDKQRD